MIALACLALSACAASPVPADRLSKIAVITPGSTNLFAGFGSRISVAAVDDISVAEATGPIELSPGTHKITMRCGDNTNTIERAVVAGEVYEFAIVATPGQRGCAGSLFRTRAALTVRDKVQSPERNR